MKNFQAKLRRFFPWLLLLVGVLLAGYVLFLKPIDVRAHAVSRGTVLVEALGTGSIEGRQTVDVSFEVTGRLLEIRVDQGDRVVKGQALASIDDQTFLAEVALAEQEVALAQSTRRRLDADIERSQAVLKGAQDALDRITPLVESGAASEEALDVAQERMNVASAELTRAQAAQMEGQEGILMANRRLDRARTVLDRTAVRSPFDGVVLRRDREVGDVATPGASVLRLVATDTVWASVWVDETYVDRLAIGSPALIALRSTPDQRYRGKVQRIGREVDRETRELLVDVSFDELPERLVFGQRVDLHIQLGRSDDVLRIPAGALLRRDGAEGVFAVVSSRAKFIPLQIGARGRELVEITGGLASDDIVLESAAVNGKPLKEGQRIRAIEPATKDPVQ